MDNFEIPDELQKRYNDECRYLALAALNQAEEYALDIDETIFSLVDTHEWLICSAKAPLVLCCTDNPNTYEEGMGTRPPALETQAAAAMIADVHVYAATLRSLEVEYANTKAGV